jgi:5'-deoxynucleotidase YfbR-like HD superfamily hydrolase
VGVDIKLDMALADTLDMKLAEILKPPEKECKLKRILAQVDKEDRDAFWWHAWEGMPTATLARALTEAGYPISDKAVKRHFNAIWGSEGEHCCCTNP